MLATTQSEPYTLEVGKKGEERLTILNEIYNPRSQKFLGQAGIKDKTRILDLACGTGLMTIWMARQAKNGRILGIDISEEQIAIAKRNAKEAGVENIEFKVLSAFDLKSLKQQFDLIYSRFIFVHIPNPEIVLQNIYDCLMPKGIMACEEATASVSFCYPKSEAFEKWLKLWAHLRKAKNTELDYGLLLPGMFHQLGCEDVKVELEQPVLQTPRERSVLRLNVTETQKTALETKFYSSEEEVKTLEKDLRALEDQPTYLIGYVRNSQVWGKKPAFFNTTTNTPDNNNPGINPNKQEFTM